MNGEVVPRPHPVVVLGVPLALGGWIPELAAAVVGMTKTPAGLRQRGLVDRLASHEAMAGVDVRDAGDLAIEPGYRVDADPRAKNRDEIIAVLPRIRDRVTDLATEAPHARLLVLGGECTIHPAVLGGLRLARGGARIALVWFDAHGDSHTTETTPSGNVWGMPFALARGRGDAGLVAASGGGVVPDDDCALMGGQALEAEEAWMLASSGVAHFGPGMLATPAGMAAFEAWSSVVRERVDGFYVAFDADVLDASGGWAVTLPEPGGMSLETALGAIRVLAGTGPVVGIGFTTMTLGNGDAARTTAAVESLTIAAFGGDGRAGSSAPPT
jgi:arginase